MDPRTILLERSMSRLQVIAVALCVALNALDGFDVLAISFAAPGLSAEWKIDRAALGVVLSMELVGMAIGSIFLGTLADRIGRRPTILACLALMAIGMLLAATAGGLAQLAIYRLLTGLGIGGMLAAINAMTAEFANARRRPLAIGFMAAGYPIGAVFGGTVASSLLAAYDWRAVFVFGGLTTLAFIPLTSLFLPESIEYLVHKRAPDALARVNRLLTRMSHPTVAALPPAETALKKSSLSLLFAPELRRTTIILTAAYFAHILTFYFLLKWTPKIVADLGFAASAAGSVLVWGNVGGALGALMFSFLTQRAGLRPLILIFGVFSFVAIAAFGRVGADLGQLALAAAIAGFCANGVVVGLYALIAQTFPAALRAGGTGFVIGVGRGGAALSPIAAGFLFAAGWGRPDVALVMSAGALIAVLGIIRLSVPGSARKASTR